jgi:hypothetical protein
MNRLHLLVAVCALSFLSGPAAAAFVAYNDTVGSSSGNVTDYNGVLVSGGSGTTSGLLKNFSDGLDTTVTATLTASNVFAGTGSISASGTDAYGIFNGVVDVEQSASYLAVEDWSYQVDFTGLDPSKTYEFVTFANRDKSAYTNRLTKFSITGADTFTNESSTGVDDLGGGVVETVTGDNTVNGYIVQWTGITAADGSFSILSQNVGLGGTGQDFRSYGMQAFRLTEVPVPATVWLFGSGLLGLIAIARRKKAA